MVDVARQLLDELMGRNRNLDPSASAKEVSWTDEEGLMEQCDKLKEEKEALIKQHDSNGWSVTAEIAASQEKQMEVCEVCGAFLIVGDAQQRIDDHLTGKQHLGYSKLRKAVDEMYEARRKNIIQLDERRVRDDDSRRRDNGKREDRKSRDHDERHNNKRDDRDRNRHRRDFRGHKERNDRYDNRQRDRHHRRDRTERNERDRARERDRSRSRSY